MDLIIPGVAQRPFVDPVASRAEIMKLYTGTETVVDEAWEQTRQIRDLDTLRALASRLRDMMLSQHRQCDRIAGGHRREPGHTRMITDIEALLFDTDVRVRIAHMRGCETWHVDRVILSIDDADILRMLVNAFRKVAIEQHAEAEHMLARKCSGCRRAGREYDSVFCCREAKRRQFNYRIALTLL